MERGDNTPILRAVQDAVERYVLYYIILLYRLRVMCWRVPVNYTSDTWRLFHSPVHIVL